MYSAFGRGNTGGGGGTQGKDSQCTVHKHKSVDTREQIFYTLL